MNLLFLADYNLSLMSLASLSVWVKIRDTSFSNLYYSIFKDGKMIGYVGLKDIKFFRKKLIWVLALTQILHQKDMEVLF